MEEFKDVIRIESGEGGLGGVQLRKQQLGFERFETDNGLTVRMGYRDSHDGLHYFNKDYDDRYLKLTGGTLTGALTIDVAHGSTDHALKIKGDTYYPLIIERANSRFRFCVAEKNFQLQFQGESGRDRFLQLNEAKPMVNGVDLSLKEALQIVHMNVENTSNPFSYNVYHEGNLDLLKRDLDLDGDLNGDFLPRDGSKPMIGPLKFQNDNNYINYEKTFYDEHELLMSSDDTIHFAKRDKNFSHRIDTVGHVFCGNIRMGMSENISNVGTLSALHVNAVADISGSNIEGSTLTARVRIDTPYLKVSGTIDADNNISTEQYITSKGNIIALEGDIVARSGDLVAVTGDIYEGGVLLSNKYAAKNHTHSGGTTPGNDEHLLSSIPHSITITGGTQQNPEISGDGTTIPSNKTFLVIESSAVSNPNIRMQTSLTERAFYIVNRSDHNIVLHLSATPGGTVRTLNVDSKRSIHFMISQMGISNPIGSPVDFGPVS